MRTQSSRRGGLVRLEKGKIDQAKGQAYDRFESFSAEPQRWEDGVLMEQSDLIRPRKRL